MFHYISPNSLSDGFLLFKSILTTGFKFNVPKPCSEELLQGRDWLRQPGPDPEGGVRLTSTSLISPAPVSQLEFN